MKHRARLGIVAVAAMACLPLGCNNTAEGVKKDAQEDTAAAQRKAADAEAAARDSAEKAKAATADDRANAKEAAGDAKDSMARAGDKAGDKVADAAKTVGATVDAAKQTLDVKAALMADKTVDASNIDVDTDDKTHAVHLKGTVPSAAQKSEAEKIARAHAAGYTIHNMLTVVKK